MSKIVIEVKDGKILGIYGSEEMEVVIYEDLKDLSDEQFDELDEEIATVPYVLYTPKGE